MSNKDNHEVSEITVNDMETSVPKTNLSKKEKPVNPWKILRSLNRDQAITFLAAFLGWTLDAFDFFTVSFAYVGNN